MLAKGVTNRNFQQFVRCTVIRTATKTFVHPACNRKPLLEQTIILIFIRYWANRQSWTFGRYLSMRRFLLTNWNDSRPWTSCRDACQFDYLDKKKLSVTICTSQDVSDQHNLSTTVNFPFTALHVLSHASPHSPTTVDVDGELYWRSVAVPPAI